MDFKTIVHIHSVMDFPIDRNGCNTLIFKQSLIMGTLPFVRPRVRFLNPKYVNFAYKRTRQDEHELHPKKIFFGKTDIIWQFLVGMVCLAKRKRSG